MFVGLADILYKKLIMFYTKNIDSFNGVGDDGATFDLFDSFKKWIREEEEAHELQNWLEESFLMSQYDLANISERELNEELTSLITTLKADYINSKIIALKAQLEEAENKSDRQETEKIYSQLSEYIKRKALLN